MWIWWRLCGERPLPGVRGVLVGQPVRLRGESAIAVVTRITAEGVTWGRRNGSHESAAAALEVAMHAVAGRPTVTREEEAALIGQLMRQFKLSEESAAGVVANALGGHRSPA